MRGKEITSTLVLLSSEVYFELNVHANSQSGRFLLITNEVPLHDVKTGIRWDAKSNWDYRAHLL